MFCAHVLNKPYEVIFSEFIEHVVPDGTTARGGDGDVKYHLGYANDRPTKQNRLVHIGLSPNPSHLELVNPVVEGIVRAKQNYKNDKEQNRVVPVLIHGDAAFTGQGIVFETLQSLRASRLAHRRHDSHHHQQPDRLHDPARAGSLYAVPHRRRQDDSGADLSRERRRSRSLRPCRPAGDGVPRGVQVRRHAGRVVLPPSWSQRDRRGAFHAAGHICPDRQASHHARVVRPQDAGREQTTGRAVGRDEKLARERMDQAYELAQVYKPRQQTAALNTLWKDYLHTPTDWSAKTAVPRDVLNKVAELATRVPADFTPHPKLGPPADRSPRSGHSQWPRNRLGLRRNARASAPSSWKVTPIRLTGQDVQRGTFSHRHAVLHDYNTGRQYTPLANLKGRPAADGDSQLDVVGRSSARFRIRI